MRLFAILAVLAGPLVGIGGLATHASALPLCEQVWLRGDWVTPQNYGGCQTYGGGTLCQSADQGNPELHVYMYVCAPDPVAAP
jgi:hypothetical protein